MYRVKLAPECEWLREATTFEAAVPEGLGSGCIVFVMGGDVQGLA